MLKKTILLLLFAVSIATLVQAQATKGSPAPPNSVIRTPEYRYLPNSRYEFVLPMGNKIVFEMKTLEQLDNLPDMDSLFSTIKYALTPLKDSLKDDVFARRIGYVVSTQFGPRITIKSYSERPPVFTYVNNELVKLKVDSDTLAFTLVHLADYKEKWRINDSIEFKEVVWNTKINFILNNISGLEELPDAILTQCLNRLNQNRALIEPVKGKKNLLPPYFATFNMTTGEMKISKPYNKPTDIKEFIPTIQMGFQYARGAFMPSASAGMQYVVRKREIGSNFLRLLWEPHFIFERDSNKKLQTFRNDFICLQYTEIFEKRNFSKLESTFNFSLGYLIRRQGDTFNENTFKFCIPSINFGSLMIEPEFFFNNFFKNFSPSLKMVVLFE